MKKITLLLLTTTASIFAIDVPSPPVVFTPGEIERDPFISHLAPSILVDRTNIVEEVTPDFSLVEFVVREVKKAFQDNIKIIGVSIKSDSRSALLNVENLNLNSISPNPSNLPQPDGIPQTAPTLGGVPPSATGMNASMPNENKTVIVFEGKFFPVSIQNRSVMEGLGLLAQQEDDAPVVVWRSKEKKLLFPIVEIAEDHVKIGLSKNISAVIEKGKQKNPSFREF